MLHTLQRTQEDYKNVKELNGETVTETPSPREMNDYLTKHCKLCEMYRAGLVSSNTCPQHTWPKIGGITV